MKKEERNLIKRIEKETDKIRGRKLNDTEKMLILIAYGIGIIKGMEKGEKIVKEVLRC